jgi:hypothetical protein
VEEAAGAALVVGALVSGVRVALVSGVWVVVVRGLVSAAAGGGEGEVVE